MQSNSINKKLDEFFILKQETDQEIFRKLTLFIYSLESGADNDLYMLAKLLPEEYLSKIINYYDGDILKMPSIEKYRKASLIAITFFLKEIYVDEKGDSLSWKEIKEIVALPENDKDMFSPISLGRKINEIKDKINHELYHIVSNLKNKEVDIDSLLSEAEQYGRK